MKLRSGKVKSEIEIRKKSSLRRKKISDVQLSQKQQSRRQKFEKYVNAVEIQKIVEKSSKLVVRIKRMSSRKDLIGPNNQPHGEVVHSENLDHSENTIGTVTPASDGEHSNASAIDNETVQQALHTPLPEYDDDDDNNERNTARARAHAQQQQQYTQPPAHTNRKKMTELLARPAKLRTDGNVSENWKNFKRQLELFMTATELNAKTSEVKAAVVLNLIGQDAIDVFDTFDLTAEQKKSYDEVLKAFDTFCKPKTNELYERYIFNKRDQKEGESFDSFLMDIKRLARTCEYKETEEMMLRDRIVFGIFNGKLRTKLLETQNLTYTMAVDKCRADEATHGFANDMNKSATIDEVKRDGVRKNPQPSQQQQQQQQQYKQNKKSHNGRRGQQQQQRQMGQTQTNERQNRNQNNNNSVKMIENCSRCTYTHKINECPAYGKNCKKCSRPNHFSNACRDRKVTTISTNEDYKEYRVNFDDEFTVETIENVNIRQRETDDAVKYPWIERIRVNGKVIPFKIDSGAEIDVLPMSQFKQLNDRIELHGTHIGLKGFGGNRVAPIGMCSLSLNYDNMTFVRQVAIVDGDTTPILGYYTCVKFGIIKLRKSKALDSINKDL